MTIYFYDGGYMTCNTIEISNSDNGGTLIVDECRCVPAIEVIRITSDND